MKSKVRSLVDGLAVGRSKTTSSKETRVQFTGTDKNIIIKKNARNSRRAGVAANGLGKAHLSVDQIVTLDHALAGKGDTNVVLGGISLTVFGHGVAVVVVIFNSPVNGIVGHMGLCNIYIN